MKHMERIHSNPPLPAASQKPSASFEPSYAIQPKSKHTHTAIVLPGRGSRADEFAEEFLASTLSDSTTLCDKLPSWRRVFPSSKELWSTAFQEHMPSWFEAHSLTDPTTRQDLQVEGLLDSVSYILQIIEEEIHLLGEKSDNVILGGISQGGAVAMWALLARQGRGADLGAVFVASTWLPFAADVEAYLTSRHVLPPKETHAEESRAPRNAVLSLMSLALQQASLDFVKTPIFIAYVDVELGRQAANVLRSGGWKIEWREYQGAEVEGHWYKVPDEMDDIYAFLSRSVS